MPPSNDRYDRHITVEDRQSTVRRVTVPEATEILGVTPDAVRSRLRRGKLRKERGEDGTVLVVLEGVVVDGLDGQGSQTDRQTTADLVEVLKDQVAYLRQQLDEAHRANAEHRRLLAAALERIPEIEAPEETPPEPRDGRETASEEAGGVGQDQDERRSWWRRFFGT